MSFMLLSLLVVGLVGGVGSLLAGSRAAEWGGAVLYFSAGLNLAGCWLGYVPIEIARRVQADWLPQAALGATVIRLLIVASGTLLAITQEWWPLRPLSVWMIVFYLSLLAVETVVVVKLLLAWGAKQSKTESA